MFNANQIKQVNELNSSKYDSLWSSVIYGSKETGEYINWKQTDPKWSNIRVGNSNGTLGKIGCLITSISILIKKSGIETNIVNFNPGTFLEALNKNNSFDMYGNLQYAGLNKTIPNFNYVGNINLRDKTKEEKRNLIKEYLDKGYYLSVEVLGATDSSQHWVAITGVNNNSVSIVDPSTNANDLWSSYEWNKTSQFNYFKAK